MNFKQFIPHLSAIAIFVAVTLVYFSPVLKGKKLFQSDIAHFEGMSQEIQKFRKETGEEALWTNSMFGGMPAYQISVEYKGNLVKYMDKIFQLGLPHPANLVFLCFLGFYFLLLCMRINPWLSIAGALAFGFSSYFFIVIDAGHNSKAHAIAYMAPVMASMILAYRGKYLLGGALTALFLSLEIYANHLQITYYLGLTIIIFLLAVFYDAIKNKTISSFIKSSAAVGVAAILAVGANASVLWSTLEYGKYTTRGKSDLTINPDGTSNVGDVTSGLDKSYATAWSYGVGETFTLLIPNFYGGSSSGELSTGSEVYKELKSRSIPNANNIIKQLPLYWGDQPFTSGPVYVGAIICFLFVLGLFLVKGNLKWWLLTATILSVILSWGKNFMAFNEIMLDYFPAYNKFRAVSMTLVIAEFTMPFLAFLALKEIFGGNISKEEILKKLKISFYSVGGLLLFFILFAGSMFDFSSSSDAQLAQSGWPDFLIDALKADRKWLLQKDALRTLVFIAITFGILWMSIKQRLKINYVFIGITLLILIDMWSVDKNYLNNDNFTAKSKVDVPYQPTQADLEILKDTDPDFRVYDATARLDQSSRTSYFHKNIGGYHGAKLKRYQELIDFHLGRRNMAVVNMLNAKYFISKNENDEMFAVPNPNALGNAWFVSEFKIVENADSEITAMNNFNPATTAVVDKKFSHELEKFSPAFDSTASIKLTEYKPNHLKYQSKANSEQLAVFSEIYYDKGWNAYIDGNLSPHFSVNYVLRAMRVPAGEHNIEFKFEPKEYFIGEKISLASSALLLIFACAGIFLYYKKQNAAPLQRD